MVCFTRKTYGGVRYVMWDKDSKVVDPARVMTPMLDIQVMATDGVTYRSISTTRDVIPLDTLYSVDFQEDVDRSAAEASLHALTPLWTDNLQPYLQCEYYNILKALHSTMSFLFIWSFFLLTQPSTSVAKNYRCQDFQILDPKLTKWVEITIFSVAL